MKKSNNNAIAIILTMIAGTAKTSAFQSSKSLVIFFFAAFTLLFSSCSRESVGCNSFGSKSNLKYSNEHKYTKYIANTYKCPGAQKYSR
jgi:hypothetical protein